MDKLLVEGTRYAGFLYSASAILYLLTSGVTHGLPPLIYMVIIAGLLAAILGYLWFRKLKSSNLPFWIAYFCATVTTVGSFAWIQQQFSLGILVALLVATIFATVIAFRVGLLAYLALTVAIALDVGYGYQNALYGLLAWILAAGSFVACNYVYQLVADHRPDFARLRLRINAKEITSGHWFRAFIIWLPALLLAGIGFKLNHDLQDAVEIGFYDAGIVAKDPDQAGDTPQRSLQLDLLFMLDTSEEADISAFEEMVVSSGQGVDDASVIVPNNIKEFLKGRRPKALSTSPCDAFRIRVLRKTITFRSPCRGVVNSISNKMQARYAQMEKKINGIASAKSEELRQANAAAIESITESGLTQIRQNYDGARKAVRQAFLVILFAQFMSYVALTGALIAGLQVTLGRVLYDSNTKNPNFQMERGTATPLQWRLSEPLSGRNGDDVLDLQDFRWKVDGHKGRYWWVSLDVRRIGEGTEMRLGFPKPAQGTLQRVFSNKFLLTRVDTGVATSRRAGKPYLHIPGDSHLVAIEMHPERNVAFRMIDFAAFTEGVQLQSIYSTHVSNHFLGLGTFQAVASGTGYLVLKTEGQYVISDSRGSAPPAALLAWDRRQQFALKQVATPIGIWFNEPSIALTPASGCAIFDQSGQAANLLRRFWRLVRYLFLPF